MQDRDRAYQLRSQQLRERAARLRAKGLSYAAIGEQLGISPIRARDIALQYQKESERRRAQEGPALPRRAVSSLLLGRYAHRVSRLVPEGAMRMAVIAAAYTWDDLLAEPGIGPKSAKLIHGWLQLQGLDFRKPGQPVAAAIEAAQYSVHSRSRLAEMNGISFDQSEERKSERKSEHKSPHRSPHRDQSQPSVVAPPVRSANRRRLKS